MTTAKKRNAVILLTMMCLAGMLLAQETERKETEKKEAVKREADIQNVQAPKPDAPLPKIDLPEFVITGTEKIDLTVDSKTVQDQERVYTPAAPTIGERPLNAGEALSPKQTKSFTRTPGAMNGRVMAGFGFYATPKLEGWFGQYDRAQSFVVNGYYGQSEGHVTDAGYWKAGIGLRGSMILPESSSVLPYAQLSGELKYGRDAYRAYASPTAFRVRDLSDLSAAVSIGSRTALPYKAMSGVDYSARLGYALSTANDSSRTSESELIISGTASSKFVETLFRAQAEYRMIGYTLPVPATQTGHWLVLRTEGRQSLVPELQITFALQQFVYRSAFGPAAGRFYPNLEFRYAFSDHASFRTGYVPTVERNTISSVVARNRYVDFASPLRPTDLRLNYFAGVEVNPAEGVTATATLTYRHINDYGTFWDRDSAKVWEVLYLSGVRATLVDVSIQSRLDDSRSISLYGTLQSVRQKDSSTVMPYVPQWTVGSSYHHTFTFGLHAEAYVEYSAKRYTDFANTHANAGFVATGAKAEMEMFGQFRATAELSNVLNRRYYLWNGYLERTIALMLGVSYQW